MYIKEEKKNNLRQDHQVTFDNKRYHTFGGRKNSFRKLKSSRKHYRQLNRFKSTLTNNI